MKYCYECDNEVDFRFVESKHTYNVKGKEYTLDVQAPVCNHCGQEVYDPDIEPEYQQLAFDMYRDEHHLLRQSEINQTDAPWIDVNDRLPDNARWVLGARRDDDVREMRYRRNWMQSYWDKPSIDSADPIYWREMPEGPQVPKEKEYND